MTNGLEEVGSTSEMAIPELFLSASLESLQLTSATSFWFVVGSFLPIADCQTNLVLHSPGPKHLQIHQKEWVHPKDFLEHPESDCLSTLVLKYFLSLQTELPKLLLIAHY